MSQPATFPDNDSTGFGAGPRPAPAAPPGSRADTLGAGLATPLATGPSGYDKGTPWRRSGLLALIIVLHLGFFYMLQTGLLQRLSPEQPMTVITAFLFAPETPTSKVPPAQPAHKPAPALIRHAAPVTPRVRHTPPVLPVPDTLQSVAPVPAPAAPVPAPVSTPVAIAPSVAPAGVPASAPSPSLQTITSGVQYLQAPQPDYPSQSRRLGEEGRVVLRVLINAQGTSERIEIEQSSGFARLDEAGREAVARARFKPHLAQGVAVAVYALIPIRFRLDQ